MHNRCKSPRVSKARITNSIEKISWNRIPRFRVEGFALAYARAFATECHSMRQRRRQNIEPGERVVTERSRAKTMTRAVNLLAAKPRSVRELRERLLEKLWTDETIVDSVIEKLKEYKYLNDDQYARDLALSKLRQKPQGKRRLQQSMSMKKLDREIVDIAIDEAFEEIPETEQIDKAITKRLRLKGKPETREDTQKFYAFLARQGFAFDLIREKMSAVADDRWADESEPPS